jgi:hypothetical protein
MTRRSVMAHCVHLSDAELELMAQRGVSGVFRSLMRSTLTEIYLCHAGSCLEMLRVHTPRQVAIAHCPTSNAYFAHGVLGVRRCWERGRGLKVGLGTDVAGGYQPSMLAALRAVRELSAILSLSLSLSLWPHSLTLSPRLSFSLCLAVSQRAVSASPAQQAVFASHVLQSGVDRIDDRAAPATGPAKPEEGEEGLPALAGGEPGAALSIREGLFLATLGGAEALDLAGRVRAAPAPLPACLPAPRRRPRRAALRRLQWVARACLSCHHRQKQTNKKRGGRVVHLVAPGGELPGWQAVRRAGGRAGAARRTSAHAVRAGQLRGARREVPPQRRRQRSRVRVGAGSACGAGRADRVFC